MKTGSKILLTTVCAMALVVASVMGTLAFLTDSTEDVVNTFTVGKVEITLDEGKVDEYGVPEEDETRVQENEYKLIPGHTYAKDPTIHVAADSEDCYVFAQIANGLGEDGTLAMAQGWTLVDGTDNVYYYDSIIEASEEVTDVVVFTEFTFGEDADPSDYAQADITITAYAVQADGFDSAVDAWTATFGA